MFNLIVGMFCAFTGGMTLGNIFFKRLTGAEMWLSLVLGILCIILAYANVYVGLQNGLD